MNIYMYTDAIIIGNERVSNFSAHKIGADTYALFNGKQRVVISLPKRTVYYFRLEAYSQGNFVFNGTKSQFEYLMLYLDIAFNSSHATAMLCGPGEIENTENLQS